jgi:hypothetical protein
MPNIVMETYTPIQNPLTMNLYATPYFTVRMATDASITNNYNGSIEAAKTILYNGYTDATTESRVFEA